jgi:hypothetical protein
VAAEDVDIFDQDHMTIDAYDPEGNLTERKIIFSASKKGDPLVSEARERSDQKMRLMELSEQLAPLKPLDLSGPSGPIIKRGGKAGFYPSSRKAKSLKIRNFIQEVTGLEIPKDLPDTELISYVPLMDRQLKIGAISDQEFDAFVRDAVLAERERFNKGGSVDSQDIFEPDLLDRGVEAYEATPLAAQILAGFTPAGLAADVASAAKYGRDAVRNLVAGKYGEAATPAILASLAAVGLIPVVGDIAKKVGSKAVRDLDMSSAAQTQRLQDMGLDVDTTMYHGTVDAGPKGEGIDEFIPGGPSGYQTIEESGRLRHPTSGIGTWFSDSPEMAGDFATRSRRYSDQASDQFPNIIPVYTRRENPLVFTFDKSIDEAFQKARDAVNNFNPALMENADGSLTDEYKNLLLKFEAAEKARANADPFVQFMIHIGLDPEKAKKFYQEGFIPEEARQKLIEQGYDSVEIRGTNFDVPREMKARGERGNQFLILDPKNIRSKYAKGDPKDRGSADISKAEGGPVEVQNMRFGGVPVPYRRGYRGPIDPSFNYGQAPQMFGRMFANRVGIGALPFIGRPATNLFSRGFRGLGRLGQRFPGGSRIGNFLNRIARPVNRVTAFQDRMNPQNVMTSGIGRLFSGGSQQGGKGMLGLRGKGGLLGFGLLGGRGTPRQAAMQQYGGAPSMLGSGAFASSYVPNIGEDVVTGRQDSSTRHSPNYTGTIESGDFDIFDTPSEPAVEYSFARAPRGSIIGTSGFASNIPYARISSLGGGGGFGGSGASSGGFGGGFTFKKEHAQDAGG